MSRDDLVRAHSPQPTSPRATSCAGPPGTASTLETTTIRWENEGYTGQRRGRAASAIEYVLRLSATWQVRQFILFRDLEEPDLWLATDGSGRWGEMNGAHRTELDGCYDIDLACTPFTNTLPIRRLPLLEGDAAELPVVHVDPETLEVRPVVQRYTRLGRIAVAVRERRHAARGRARGRRARPGARLPAPGSAGVS